MSICPTLAHPTPSVTVEARPASIHEVRAWLDFQPCACGSLRRCDEELCFDVDPDIMHGLAEGLATMTMSFTCKSCGCGRRFTFDIGLFYPDGGPAGMAFSTRAEPSELLDPVRFYHIALHHIRQIPADLGSLDGLREIKAAGEHVGWAMAALQEVDKSFGDGDILSPAPNWSEDSRRLFAANPERYNRACVLENQLTLCDVLDTLERYSQRWKVAPAADAAL